MEFCKEWVLHVDFDVNNGKQSETHQNVLLEAALTQGDIQKGTCTEL